MPFMEPMAIKASTGVKPDLDYLAYDRLAYLMDGLLEHNPNTLTELLNEALFIVNQGSSDIWVHPVSMEIKKSPPGEHPPLVGIVDKFLNHIRKNKLDACNTFPDLDIEFYITRAPEMGEGWVRIHADYNKNKLRQSRSLTRQPVMLKFSLYNMGESEWIVNIPIFTLFKTLKFKQNGSMGYAHYVAMFKDDDEITTDNVLIYYGITTRHWLKRMREHMRDMNLGSNKLFHRTWRELVDNNRIQFYSSLEQVGRSFDEIMNWEERVVDQSMEDNTSLNMIPGGFKGLRFLHEHRLLGSRRPQTTEERNAALEQFERNSKRGPNLLLRAMWLNDEYALKIICGGEKRLSPDQVRRIRALGEQGKNFTDILKQTGARNVGQIKRVLDGESYSRVR